jgi:hypothetical protein
MLNIMFYFKNNVSKLELRNSLKETISKNEDALDYLQNRISTVDNLVKYNENDNVSKEELKNLKYIEFCLKYLDGLYRDNLKKVCK